MAKKETLKDIAAVGRSLDELKNATLAFEALHNEQEQRLQEIRDAYSARLNELCLDLEVEEKLLKAWLKANKKDFDGPPRSMSFPSGTIGYEKGQPHLELVDKKKWTWEKVLKAIESRAYTLFIRTKKEVDKEEIMKQIAISEALDSKSHPYWFRNLSDLGLKKAQDDRAFIRLNREEKAI